MAFSGMIDDRRGGRRAKTAGEQRGRDQFDRWCFDTQRSLETAESARIQVYVRSLLPPPGAKEAQTTVIQRLERGAETIDIDEVLVDVWGERLCLCEDCRDRPVGRRLLDRVRTFESWGEEYDASVGSFFERSRQESEMTGGSYDGVVPPRVTAALYVDGTVAGVFPARFGDERYSVTDLADALPRLTDRAEATEPIESSQ